MEENKKYSVKGSYSYGCISGGKSSLYEAAHKSGCDITSFVETGWLVKDAYFTLEGTREQLEKFKFMHNKIVRYMNSEGEG